MFEKEIKPHFYIRHVAREDAEGPLKQIYANFPEQVMIPGPVLIKSSVPELAGMNASELGYFMGHKTVSREVLTAIRYILAVRVNSAYCTHVNGKLLLLFGFKEEQLADLLKNNACGAFTDKENALIDFAVNASMEPTSVDAAKMDKVKSFGWTDEDLLAAVVNGIDSVAGINVFKVFQVKES